VATEIKRHAARLRSHLTDLGLRYVPVGARVTGRHLDRAQIRALVTRGDPRILRARQLLSENDLFIGVAVDCSSSMQVGDNIARAQRFGVLVAEAVRGLPGVDARFFGFTDTVLYDAGDDHRCAVAALPCGGGNNDAAALYHLAEEARRSRRRARVLVMISDGLPTQCSVAALRGLVANLSRRRLLCAQVAVRPLEEVCFPSYVLLDGADVEVAVARFGRMVGDLARRALGVS
jgi:nitric oxide reductase activation protein